MNAKRTGWRMLACVLILLLAGCSRRSGTSEIIVAGSTSVQPFADKWAEVFGHRHPGRSVNVQGGGSSAGIQAAKSGAADIGMSSRELKPDEKDLHEIIVARDGLAIIVHPSNPVSDVDLGQIKAVFTGGVKDWSVLGGKNRAITVVSREEGSGTRGAFQELVLGRGVRIFKRAIVEDSNGTVREIVANDPDAIGYISLGLVNDSVKALNLDGVRPTEDNILAGRYRLVRPFLFLTKNDPSGLSKEFIDFVLSSEGQNLIREEGLISAE